VRDDAEVCQNLGTLRWGFGPEEQEAVARVTDVVVIEDDPLLRAAKLWILIEGADKEG